MNQLNNSEFVLNESYRLKERSIFWSLIIDVLLLQPDIIAAVLSNSLSMYADIFKCMCEIFATFFSWLTLRRLMKGKTHFYNYGLGKLESMTELAVAMLMLFSVFFVLEEALERLETPEMLNTYGMIIGIISLLVGANANLYLWRKNLRIAKKNYSPVMESQWRLFRTKFFADLTILLALAFSMAFVGYKWVHYIDPIGSLIIVCFILYSIYGIISNSVGDLLDKTLDESLQLMILKELTTFFHSYKNLHGIRSRRAGVHIFIEIFLEFEENKSMGEVQREIDNIKNSIEKKIKNSNVIISPTTKKMNVI